MISNRTQVVTANGDIVKASPRKHKDLHWALRGGGNNFGLVVSFDLKTIPLPGGQVWGGFKTFAEPTFPLVDEAFSKVIEDIPNDPKAAI